ncbi:hypothetical protein DNTS_018831 [Danionella cerebrum]|uniref:Uncharacterized protein n=1 Tax=Danionella cerebrum TaxID=2873325 RepID=A0A553MS57_9TELE|nr:hypothetical protein DNTS_018831 [Danionella translucida]
MRVVLLTVVPDRRVQCLARGLVVLIALGEPAACYTGNSGGTELARGSSLLFFSYTVHRSHLTTLRVLVRVVVCPRILSIYPPPSCNILSLLFPRPWACQPGEGLISWAVPGWIVQGSTGGLTVWFWFERM